MAYDPINRFHQSAPGIPLVPTGFPHPVPPHVPLPPPMAPVAFGPPAPAAMPPPHFPPPMPAPMHATRQQDAAVRFGGLNFKLLDMTIDKIL
jgi:hypothetical protein